MAACVRSRVGLVRGRLARKHDVKYVAALGGTRTAHTRRDGTMLPSRHNAVWPVCHTLLPRACTVPREATVRCDTHVTLMRRRLATEAGATHDGAGAPSHPPRAPAYAGVPVRGVVVRYTRMGALVRLDPPEPLQLRALPADLAAYWRDAAVVRVARGGLAADVGSDNDDWASGGDCTVVPRLGLVEYRDVCARAVQGDAVEVYVQGETARMWRGGNGVSPSLMLRTYTQWRAASQHAR